MGMAASAVQTASDAVVHFGFLARRRGMRNSTASIGSGFFEQVAAWSSLWRGTALQQTRPTFLVSGTS